MVIEQLERLRNETDDEVNRQKMTELEDDLALRKAQISDLQQKILSADQGIVLYDNIDIKRQLLINVLVVYW